MDCSRCGDTITGEVPGWCAACDHTERVDAAALLDWLLDSDGRSPVRAPAPRQPDPLAWPDHDELLAAATERSGTDESVSAARGVLRVGGAPVVVVAWSFTFLGGSMGQVAGARIAAAYDVAREARLPIVLLPSTGGARMQEGMASLAQLAVTTVAQQAHADAGLLQVAVLRDPTTGGVFASHANLADVVLAERGATIGFAGPRVSEAMTGGPLPRNSHTAAGAAAAGLVDEVVTRPALPGRLAALVGWTSSPRPRPVEVEVDAREWGGDRATGPGAHTAWAEVRASRSADRLRAPAFLADGHVTVHGRLRGDRAGTVDPAVDVVLARVAGRPCVVIAMDPDGGAIGPAGYRTAWRGVAVAGRTGVPVVTLVDTPGADASASAEAGGVAHHIATTFARMLAATTPVVALVVGEGGSGGALALAVGDRLLLQEHATFSVIAPEGAAAILHRDVGLAEEVAGLLDPTAARLRALGIADEVVDEPTGAEVTTAWAAVVRHLDALAGQDTVGLRDRRRDRWRDPLHPRSA